MPVTLTVSQVRDALYRAERDSNADAKPTSTAVLGQWFHDGLTWLISNRGSDGPLALLADVDADLEVWKATLVQAAYDQFAGPRLTRGQAGLHESPEQVMHYWLAMRAACHWLAELCWSVRQQRPSRRSKRIAPWQSLSDLIQANEPLRCELREPEWTDSVNLVGVADAVIRSAGSGAWCVVEFKTGQSSPAADLGQTCLYHMILSSLAQQDQSIATDLGTLALVRFTPDRQERLFSGRELIEAREQLLNLIGQLAGVCGPGAAIRSSATGKQSAEDRSEARETASTCAVPRTPRAGLVAEDRYLELGKQIVRTFAEYNVEITLDHPIVPGPAFLRFPITLGRGTKVDSVEKRTAELQVRLGLQAEPFISRDHGRLVVDVQRPDRQTIFFDEIRDQLPAPNTLFGNAVVPVGVDLEGELVCADLSRTEHAHLLVAGTTGSGKSEWLRLAIAGLISTNTPETLRLLIIDPKRNAFHALRESPYLWKPLVFPDEHNTAEILEQLCTMMDERYRQLDGADNVAALAARSQQPLPRIVCVCDEYRDLISRGPKERKQIEALICRLGAKARAAGIHLILATQEASRETVKGALDSNLPARVGLKMGRHLESNMLLGQAGAEKLLGHGDLLFKDIGAPRRLQAPLLTEANREAIFSRMPVVERKT